MSRVTQYGERYEYDSRIQKITKCYHCAVLRTCLLFPLKKFESDS